MKIVIPMAGQGKRFSNNGYIDPKPFIDVNGRMMIDRVLENIQLEAASTILIIQETFSRNNTEQLSILRDKYGVNFVSVEKVTLGACCTAMAAHRLINDSEPVLFVDSDNLFFNDVIRSFVEDAQVRGLDGSLLTTYSQNPAFSYARSDMNGYVVETKEKSVISTHAVCGAYYYARGADFVDAAISMMMYGDTQKNEYYMSSTYNYMIKNGYNVGFFDIPAKHFACLGTPEQLEYYLHG